MTSPSHSGQDGAITLLVAIGLVVLASMTAFFSARSVLIDQLASHNHARSSQARLAAEAALASAQSTLMQSPNVGDFMRKRTPCPAKVSGPEWQCSDIAVAPLPALSETTFSVVAVRNLVLFAPRSDPAGQRSPHGAKQPGTGSRKVSGFRHCLRLPPMRPWPHWC